MVGHSAHTLERRLERRAPVDFFVTRLEDGRPELCRAVDICWRGILLEGEPKERRRLYAMQLDLPGESPVWVWARSVRASDGKHALRFVGLDEADGRTLARFLDSVAG